MNWILSVIIAALLLLPGTALAKRHHVIVHKAPPVVSQQPARGTIAVIPVVGILYDLGRRTNCQGDALGLGGAGFDPEPKTGNFLIPAIYRRQCMPQPKGR